MEGVKLAVPQPDAEALRLGDCAPVALPDTLTVSVAELHCVGLVETEALRERLGVAEAQRLALALRLALRVALPQGEAEGVCGGLTDTTMPMSVGVPVGTGAGVPLWLPVTLPDREALCDWEPEAVKLPDALP